MNRVFSFIFIFLSFILFVFSNQWKTIDSSSFYSSGSSNSENCPGGCPINSVCTFLGLDGVTNTRKYECLCTDGFVGRPSSSIPCSDLDECAQGIHSCHPTQECINTQGGYRCVCGIGWEASKEGGCECDKYHQPIKNLNENGETIISECVPIVPEMIIHPKQTIEQCQRYSSNTQIEGNDNNLDVELLVKIPPELSGLYVRKVTKGQPFEVVSTEITPSGIRQFHTPVFVNSINECEIPDSQWTSDPLLLQKSSTSKIYHSDCRPRCHNLCHIDPSTNKHEECSQCIDTEDSYECQCREGYSLEVDTNSNQNKCVKKIEINSVVNPTHPQQQNNNNDNKKSKDECSKCSQHAVCQPKKDVPNEKKCVCSKGFEGDGKNCNDIDECLLSPPCPLNSICKNTIGSYECECKKGHIRFKLQCINDPCSTSPCPHDHICRSTPDSSHPYSCECNSDQVSYDGKCIPHISPDPYPPPLSIINGPPTTIMVPQCKPLTLPNGMIERVQIHPVLPPHLSGDYVSNITENEEVVLELTLKDGRTAKKKILVTVTDIDECQVPSNKWTKDVQLLKKGQGYYHSDCMPECISKCQKEGQGLVGKCQNRFGGYDCLCSPPTLEEVDLNPPVITLVGGKDVYQKINWDCSQAKFPSNEESAEFYKEQGFIAFDDENKGLNQFVTYSRTSRVTSETSEKTNSQMKSFVITYSVSDLSNNRASVERKVNLEFVCNTEKNGDSHQQHHQTFHSNLDEYLLYVY